MFHIQIPETLRPKDAINCASYISQLTYFREFCYDFSRIRHCPAFGLLVILNAVRACIKKFPKSKHTLLYGERESGFSYAAYMNLFNATEHVDWQQPLDTLPDKYTHDRVIKITKIDSAELERQYPVSCWVQGEMVDFYAKQLARTLTQQLDTSFTASVSYCIREVMRNSFEHSGSDVVWVCGQYWPSRKCAEIAIMDEGNGILRSLTSNQRFKIKSDEEANLLAIEPGISRTVGTWQDPDDPWQNSGFGLFMAKSICAQGGHFIISSGNSTIFADSSHLKKYKSKTNGTIICMALKMNSSKDFSTVLQALREKGEQLSRMTPQNRILTASKMSSLQS